MARWEISVSHFEDVLWGCHSYENTINSFCRTVLHSNNLREAPCIQMQTSYTEENTPVGYRHAFCFRFFEQEFWSSKSFKLSIQPAHSQTNIWAHFLEKYQISWNMRRQLAEMLDPVLETYGLHSSGSSNFRGLSSTRYSAVCIKVVKNRSNLHGAIRVTRVRETQHVILQFRRAELIVLRGYSCCILE